MEIVRALLKKNKIQIILYSIIFIVCFAFADICIFLGNQLQSFAGIMLIGGVILYLFIIVTTMLKMQVIIDRSIWKSLFQFGLLYRESYIITASIDSVMLVIGLVLSKVTSNYAIGYFVEQKNEFAFSLVCCGLVEVVVYVLAYFYQNIFISRISEDNSRNQSFKVYENSPLFLKNVLRNKDKMCVVVGIICTGVIACNSVIFILNCDKREVYLDKAISVDYFLTEHDTGSDEQRNTDEIVKESDIEKVEQEAYFKAGGRLYHSLDENRVSMNTNQLPEKSEFPLFYQFDFERDNANNYLVNLYGADIFVLDQMELYDGVIDYEKLATGNYIIYGLEREPTSMEYTGDVCEDWKYFNVGDKVALLGEAGKKEYEIMAICIVNHTYAENHAYSYPGRELVFYLPANEYLTYGSDEAMRYLFNTNEAKVIDSQLSSICFESKHGWYERYMEDVKLIRESAIFFALGCVGIGFFVYMNILIVSYMDRKKEFVVLGNIGMTSRQIRAMVVGEGITYGIFISLLCVILSGLVEVMGKFLLLGNTWEFQITIAPLVVSVIAILVISVIIPIVVHRKLKS